MIATFFAIRRAAGRAWILPAAIAAFSGAPAAERSVSAAEEPRGVVQSPDPLTGTEAIDPSVTWTPAADGVASMLPPRSDTAADWIAPLDPLHFCGEPRLLPTCVPPPPCHPALPPQPHDLVGTRGKPTPGPIYRGPCAPRAGSGDCRPCPRAHRVHDRLFDWFYNPRTPIFP
ncbi:MAG: hypothetical protein ACKOC8_12680 [Pirellulales bacterium]